MHQKTTWVDAKNFVDDTSMTSNQFNLITFTRQSNQFPVIALSFAKTGAYPV